MRGEIWSFAPPGARASLPLVVVQADALNETAPTVVGLVVTDQPQTAGEPLVVTIEPDELETGDRAWVKVNHLRTVAASDARDRIGELTPNTRARVDAALAAVLELGSFSAGPGRAQLPPPSPPT